jgi:hypothetical protein
MPAFSIAGTRSNPASGVIEQTGSTSVGLQFVRIITLMADFEKRTKGDGRPRNKKNKKNHGENNTENLRAALDAAVWVVLLAGTTTTTTTPSWPCGRLVDRDDDGDNEKAGVIAVVVIFVAAYADIIVVVIITAAVDDRGIIIVY